PFNCTIRRRKAGAPCRRRFWQDWRGWGGSLAASPRGRGRGAWGGGGPRGGGGGRARAGGGLGAGVDSPLGEGASPGVPGWRPPNRGTPWPKFINKSYARSIDFDGRASRVERVRMQGENPPHGGGQQPIVGEQPVNQTIIVNAETPWVQQLEIVMMPHGFLRAA